MTFAKTFFRTSAKRIFANPLKKVKMYLNVLGEVEDVMDVLLEE